ncbi:hypothetical protein [Tenacibaculum sp.]|uniref:hypothetical protein n=1 Tax=Tenacibaculum sp. TaxID=1906242 RepID=UPI003AA8EBFB
MKNLLIFFILFGTAINAQDRYDFSRIKSSPNLQKLLLKIMQENGKNDESLIKHIKESKIVDGISIHPNWSTYSSKVTVKGMHYNGIPISTAIFYSNGVKLTTDSIAYSAKNILQTLEAKNGLTITYNNRRTYNWDKETVNINLSIKLINGKNLAFLGNKDYAILNIKFKPTYKIPLAHIHSKIKTYDKQPDYTLVSQTSNLNYDIVVNNIKVVETYSRDRLRLNKYITDNITNVKIIVKPNPDYKEGLHYSARILDLNNHKELKEIKGAFISDRTVVFETNFNSELPYYPNAWTTGIDLRKEKNLKEKIIAFYKKLGKAIIENDEEVLNNIFYQRQYEIQQLDYDTRFQTARTMWRNLLRLKENKKYTISNDFEIEFSANGKLIYPHPKDINQMLIFEKGNYGEELNFYFYQPKGLNELKLIR